MMLIDPPQFEYAASVPWPRASLQQSQAWQVGVRDLEHWLCHSVGAHWVAWHWCDSRCPGRIGVSFRWAPDRTLFMLTWSGTRDLSTS